MKVVLLAGGFGSRLAEETSIKPKPLVEIGGIPIIEHIMNWYMSFGYNEFIICLGYKGSEIISYFKEYNYKNSSCVINENGKIETLSTNKKKWKIILAQTGIKTQTAGRLKKISKYLHKNEEFDHSPQFRLFRIVSFCLLRFDSLILYSSFDSN